MRICIVSDLYYPYPGGVSEHVHHTAIELRKLGHDVKILTTNYFGLAQETIEKVKDTSPQDSAKCRVQVIRVGIAIPRPTNKSMGIMPVGIGLSSKVKEVILGGNFDIIHTHGMSPILPLLATRYSKSVNIITSHSSMPEFKLYKYIAYLLQSYIKKADGLIAVSNESLATIERFIGRDHTIVPSDRGSAGFITGKFVNVRYTIIPNGIDTERFSPSIEPLAKFRDGGPYILFVGRNEPRKGLKYLLKLFPKVLKELPTARLITVGKGVNKIKNQIKNVYFEGFVSPEDMPRYYASCDVYCSPATGRESFGIVLLEAMSSGKPVIASNIPGYREVITDGKDGILVEPENPDMLVDALVRVLTDNELKQSLSVEGRKTALKYSWDKVTKEIEKFYYELMSRKKSNY